MTVFGLGDHIMYQSVFVNSLSGQFVAGCPRPHRDRVWTRVYDQVLGPNGRPLTMLQVMDQVDTVYDRWSDSVTQYMGNLVLVEEYRWSVFV